ncbi:MAG: hypothetical protein WBD31_25415 [Rubripirellula sp.]
MIALLMASFPTIGCQPKAPTRQAISGTVAVPDSALPSGLPSGTLTFLPTEGHAGPATSTTVVDGAFEFATSNGPLPGTYRAVFTMDTDGDEAKVAKPTSKSELLASRAEDRDDGNRTEKSRSKFEARLEIPQTQGTALQLNFEG